MVHGPQRFLGGGSGINIDNGGYPVSTSASEPPPAKTTTCTP
ncbi:hypothetical protein ACFVXW_16300 [Streptomyces sp. NPDC058251]